MSSVVVEPRPGHGFAKSERLLRRADFLTAQARGRRLHAPHFVIVLLDRGDGAPPRIGITASRKVANSVGRNRVRRLVREVFRTHKGAFPAGHDCVVIVRENVPDLALAVVRDELLEAFARRGRRPPPSPSPPSAPSPPGAKPHRDAQQGHAAPAPPARGGGPRRR